MQLYVHEKALPFVSQCSKEKFVNDLLCGIHLCAAAEAMVLGVGAGLDPRVLFDIISNAAGNSWYMIYLIFLPSLSFQFQVFEEWGHFI